MTVVTDCLLSNKGAAFGSSPGTPTFPTANTLEGHFRGRSDVFIAKLNAEGSALVYSTYLGGSGTDFGVGIAVDSAGNVYATGYTDSTDFPRATALQADFGGSFDAFVTKLDSTGSALVYSAYLGRRHHH